jgi:hypothetical protein
MTLKECIDKWVTGEHEYIQYGDNKFYINVYGFLCIYRSNDEMAISNTQWLTSDEWKLIKKEVIPEGFVKAIDGSYYKLNTYKRYVNLFWNKSRETVEELSYKNEEAARKLTKPSSQDLIYLDTITVTSYYNIFYDKIKGDNGED